MTERTWLLPLLALGAFFLSFSFLYFVFMIIGFSAIS
jgi:hypothetical protein